MLKDFLGDLVVKILLSSAGGASSIPGQETKIPQALGQLSLCTATNSLTACVPQENQAQSKKNLMSILMKNTGNTTKK